MAYKDKNRSCHCGKALSENSHIAECHTCMMKRKDGSINFPRPKPKAKICHCGNIIHVNSAKLYCNLCVQQMIRKGVLSSPRHAGIQICGCGSDCSAADRYSYELTGRHMIDPSLDTINSNLIL